MSTSTDSGMTPAQAVYEAFNGPKPWRKLSKTSHAAYERAAQAAIDAHQAQLAALTADHRSMTAEEREVTDAFFDEELSGVAQAAPSSEQPSPNCADCGLHYDQFGTDFVFSHEEWKELFPPKDGLLCGTCICRRVAKLPDSVRIDAAIHRLGAAPSSEPATEPQYRMLEVGEQIQAGDDYEYYRDCWLPTENTHWRVNVSQINKYRRRIAPAPKPSTIPWP